MAEEDDEDTEVIREAPLDAGLSERLAVPSSAGAIYLDEASVYRPLVTGDILLGPAVPGSTAAEMEYGLTMIVSHPSVMREGAVLNKRAQAAPVIPISGVRKTEWTPDRFDIFPLPLLKQFAGANGFEVANRPWAADLTLCGPIDTDQLDVTSRVACLSPEGIVLLLQRRVHTDTRAAVRIDTLHHVFAPKLEEIELLETWCEERAAPQVAKGGDLVAELAAAALAFEEFLSTEDASGACIGDLLKDDLRRSQARRAIEAELVRLSSP